MVNGKQHEFILDYEQRKLPGSTTAGRVVMMLLCFLVLSTAAVSAQEISVGLMDRKSITSMLFSPSEGRYVVLAQNGDTIYTFRSDDAISISPLAGSLLIKSAYGAVDTVAAVKIIGTGHSPHFKVRFNGEKRDQIYFDKLLVSVEDGLLKTINKMDIERYVARVVQSEVGAGAVEEYYKIQSIICRTYAVRNLIRHTLQGFDLCDHEHCQVFSGLKPASNEVMKATSATSGLVMVGPDNELILSAFHANCGGQTANSEDVWLEARPYLTSVQDTFCLNGRSAVWDKAMPLNELLLQLGFSAAPSELSDFSYQQPDRKKYFAMGKDSITTVQMRRLLQLRSTFFDLSVKDGNVVFSGRGYGHGVGLCQQGAMSMAENGYTYSQILGYYYKGVSLIPLTALQPEK